MPGKKAFTLIEALISIAILSVGMVTVLQAVSFSSRIAGLACDIIDANFTAKDILSELEFKEKLKIISAVDSQKNTGRFICAYSIAQDLILNLYKTTISISWDRMNRKNEVVLTTFLINAPK